MESQGPSEGQGKTPRNPIPPERPDFNQIVQVFGMQALMSAGKLPNPMTGKYESDAAMTRHHISTLELLEEKTRGNLTEDEERTLRDVLHQARMAFLDIARKGDKPTGTPGDSSKTEGG